ncbi:MAG: matrixin family metalloprotease, partial [Acidobacteria bacterium]|nr:matrixin family metalloprotease [Acidobacteriota bacterium]
SGPVPYFITERGIPNVSATQLRDAVGLAFASWQAVSDATVRSQFQGMTIAPPGTQDQRTTFGFLDRPELDRVLAATSFLLDSRTGEIREADVFFNTRFDWSVAAAGEAGRIDLESVALHEIGHLLGLGHSAIGETELSPNGRRVIASGAVMFPISFSPGAIADRLLQPDDRAGIRDLYPGTQFDQTTSSISGFVTKGGRGVLGAHAVAINLRDGTTIGGFTLNAEGEFVIGGVSPGTYLVRVEPLDDADTDSFFSGPIDVDFQVAYGARIVIAPAGGGADPITVPVRAK